jgi:hemoglobin
VRTTLLSPSTLILSTPAPTPIRRHLTLQRTLVAWLLTLVLTACVGAPTRSDALYRDLGELPGITAIVEGMLFRLVDNPRIAHHFAQTDIVNLRDRLVEQLCVEAGGPCTYTGLPMDEAHIGMDIDQSDFNALVEDLQMSMEDLDVPVATQNRLLARLAPMRRDILHR